MGGCDLSPGGLSPWPLCGATHPPLPARDHDSRSFHLCTSLGPSSLLGGGQDALAWCVVLPGPFRSPNGPTGWWLSSCPSSLSPSCSHLPLLISAPLAPVLCIQLLQNFQRCQSQRLGFPSTFALPEGPHPALLAPGLDALARRQAPHQVCALCFLGPVEWELCLAALHRVLLFPGSMSPSKNLEECPCLGARTCIFIRTFMVLPPTGLIVQTALSCGQWQGGS